MKEFIDKLIGRLEDEMAGHLNLYCDGLIKAMSVAKELAEEHKDNVMIDGQYCWQTCGATENCKECNRLCNGSIDYYENYDCLVEE